MRDFHSAIIIAAVGSLLCGCFPPGNGSNGTSDAGGDSTGDFTVTLGKTENESFSRLTDGTTMEVVSGIQGGWHVEPALRMTDVSRDSFITVVTYTITDADTGDQISQSPSMYRIDAGAWEMDGNAYIRLRDQVRFDVSSASEAAGRTVELRVKVEIEEGGGFVVDTATVELVDEVDELSGPQPG